MIVWTWIVTAWTVLLHWLTVLPWPWLAAAVVAVVAVVVVADRRQGGRRC